MDLWSLLSWPDNLTYLASSRSMRLCLKKQGGWHLKNSIQG